jgi:sulfatase modifying factor 1
MKYALALAIAFALFYPLRVAAITIDTVPIGNVGNAAESQPGQPSLGHAGGLFGSVATNYRIATTEVTNAQYTAFLNAVAASDPNSLYDARMTSRSRGGIVQTGTSGSFTYSVKGDVSDGGPGNTNYTYGDKPVVFVSWFDAARFANWMSNGQPSGAQSSATTEGGAYTLNGSNPVAVARNSNATWFIPTENQWYKAAYYNGPSGVYYDYPTKSNTAPDNQIPLNDSGNSANYFAGAFTQQESYPYTTVGAYAASNSVYGTSDQGGNVWEWTEAFGINSNNTQNTSLRVIRGGAFDSDVSTLNASYGLGMSSGLGNDDTGFRLATIAAAAGLPGDYNNNGVVDAGDYILWRKSPASFGGDPAGYNTWRTHFGQTSPGSGSGSLLQNAVLEPAAMPLIAAFAAAALVFGIGSRPVRAHAICK